MRREYRCPQSLVASLRRESWYVGDPTTAHVVQLTPPVFLVLDAFRKWAPAQRLGEVFAGLTPRACRKLLRSFIEAGLLEERRLPNTTENDVWASWAPEGAFFHFGTKDTPWATDPIAGERSLNQKFAVEAPPPPVRRLPRANQRVRLPRVALAGALHEALTQRRTWREFGPQPVRLDDLSLLLERTWGVQHRAEATGQGPIVLKTSPSGGACHPIEAYVLARKVAGLPPGLYHFEADSRKLALIRRGATSRDIGRYLPGQPWFDKAAAVVFMTAVFSRTAWRYPVPRAYRGLLLEAGHLCQTFLLVATDLKLAPFCTMALADSVVEHALGVDGRSEGVLYAAGVGTRPARWQPGLPARYRRGL